MRLEQKIMLVKAVATKLVEKRIVEVGQEEWAKKAATQNLTVDEFTEVQIWSATGPIHLQFISLTDEVIDALARLVGIEVPPKFVADGPDLNVVG